MLDGHGWIDITVPLSTGMVVYPGDPPVVVEQVSQIGRGSSCNLSHISMGVHSGTHVDAPLHFLENGASIDHLPFTALIGMAQIIAIPAKESITLADIKNTAIGKDDIILFKTGNSILWQDPIFHEDYVYLSESVAAYLAEKEVAAVGIDYLSIGGFHRNQAEVHRTLLEASIVIIEGLDLSKITPGSYEFICLPLKVGGAEGAPARVLVRKERARRDSNPKPTA